MNLKRIGVSTLAAIAIWTGVGRAQQTKNSVAANATMAKPADKVVMKIGSRQITQSEFETIVAALGPRAEQAVAEDQQAAVGRSYATLVALSQNAVAENLDKMPVVRETISLLRMQALAQAEVMNLQKEAVVTPVQIRQYFNAHKDKFPQAQVRVISVAVKPPDAPATVPGLSETEAEARLEAIRKALEAPGADIGKVASQFNVPDVVNVGTKPRTVLHGQTLRQDIDQEVFSAKDGQLTKTIHTLQGLLFLQVVNHQAHLKPVSDQIEQTLRGQIAREKIRSLTQNAGVWMDPAYFHPTPAALPATQAPQNPSTSEKKSSPSASGQSAKPPTKN